MVDEAERKLNLEIALEDPGTFHKKIKVKSADDGEELTDEVKEPGDGENVDILESGEVDKMDDEMTIRTHDVKIDELTQRLGNVESRLFDYMGDEGHITKTKNQFEEIKLDISKGFSSVTKGQKDQEETILFAIGELRKIIEKHAEQLDNHKEKIEDLEDRVEAIEKRHEKEDNLKTENRAIVKKAMIGAAVGGSGLTGGILAFFKFVLSRGEL